MGEAGAEVKRKAVKADEHDVVTGWRHVLCYMKRPGVTSGIKRRMRRRERREGKRPSDDEL